MTLVFTTSRGVVKAAARPPAILPHTAASYACNGLSRKVDSFDLRSSYTGNCSDVNGISNTDHQTKLKSSAKILYLSHDRSAKSPIKPAYPLLRQQESSTSEGRLGGSVTGRLRARFDYFGRDADQTRCLEVMKTGISNTERRWMFVRFRPPTQTPCVLLVQVPRERGEYA